MAEAEKDAEKEKTEGASSSGGKKKGILLGGGVLALVGMAYFAFLMAVPAGVDEVPLEGPFVANLSESQLSVNLAGHDNKNYLALEIKAEYVAYEEAYVANRTADPLYQAKLVDRTIVVVSAKSKEEISGAVGKDVLREELREAIDPILFPIHIGATATPNEADPESGLAVGTSIRKSSFRGLFFNHVLHVDAPDGTIAIDEGEKIRFGLGDDDVRVVTPAGDTLYLDTSGLDPHFVGEVRVGCHGRIKNFLFAKFLLQ